MESIDAEDVASTMDVAILPAALNYGKQEVGYGSVEAGGSYARVDYGLKSRTSPSAAKFVNTYSILFFSALLKIMFYVFSFKQYSVFV